MLGFQADMMGCGVPWPVAQTMAGAQVLAQTATGNNQATACVLNSANTEFTTVAASTGAILPGTTGRVTAGDVLLVVNNGANTLAVYPPVGFRIGTTATNGAVSVPANKTALFQARGDGNYFAFVSA